MLRYPPKKYFDIEPPTEKYAYLAALLPSEARWGLSFYRRK